MALRKLILFSLVLSFNVYAVDKFTPLPQILNEANANNDKVEYIYVLKRCGALLGSVAGYESKDNRDDAKKLVKINNDGAEFFISTSINANKKLNLQSNESLVKDIQEMAIVYVDNFNKNRLLYANIFTGFVEQDYKVCIKLYKDGIKKWKPVFLFDFLNESWK